MKGLPLIQSLMFELKKLPGIGPRSAERLVQYFLKTEDLKSLSSILSNLNHKIKKCKECFSFTEEKDLCSFCEDDSRNKDLICVVEQAFDIFRIENCGIFKGYYHVLHGVLSPLNHIHPKDLTLKQLKERVLKKSFKEMILAIDSDLEGDTTALYIMESFKELDIKISRPALGIPLGSDLSFVDNKTLGQAIENRSYF
ncbi:MAG: recombination mediator RecR [Bdellovibrionaceae bacterium]|nr:recombination mediator RecR [Pseudobdellovibrionaceae bacterium]